MKHVRTARGYQSLTVEGTTVDGTPREVSNELADKLEKAGAEYGVKVLVFDKAEDAAEGIQHRAAQSGQAPDLSAGIAIVTGTGAPVETTPEGASAPEAVDGQELGDADQGGQPNPDQPNTPAVSAKSGKPAKGATTTEGN